MWHPLPPTLNNVAPPTPNTHNVAPPPPTLNNVAPLPQHSPLVHDGQCCQCPEQSPSADADADADVVFLVFLFFLLVARLLVPIDLSPLLQSWSNIRVQILWHFSTQTHLETDIQNQNWSTVKCHRLCHSNAVRSCTWWMCNCECLGNGSLQPWSGNSSYSGSWANTSVHWSHSQILCMTHLHMYVDGRTIPHIANNTTVRTLKIYTKTCEENSPDWSIFVFTPHKVHTTSDFDIHVVADKL